MTPLARARAIINEVAAARGVDPQKIVSRCRVQSVFRARIEVAKRLNAMGYIPTRIGRILNHDHTTIVFYLERGQKRPTPERPPRPPRKRVWRAPKVRHLRWIAGPKKPPTRYAGWDPTERHIAT